MNNYQSSSKLYFRAFLVFYFLLFFNGFFFGQDDKKAFAQKTFTCIKNNDTTNFIKLLLTPSATKKEILKRKNYGVLTPEKDKKLDSIIMYECNKNNKEQLITFKKIRQKATQLKFDWNNIILDSILFDVNEKKEFDIRGTYFFKKNNNEEYYKMFFVILITDSIFINNVFLPHKHSGPKNRIATAGLKQNYINNCIKDKTAMRKAYPSIYPSPENDCIKCECEKQYINETEFDDGVARIKNAKFHFNYIKPPKK